MFLNAIIFEKLRKVFTQLNADAEQCFLTFAPIPTNFSNEHFNFLNTNLPLNQQNSGYENRMAFAYFANAIARDSQIFKLTTEDFLQDSYKKIIDQALLI